MKTATLSTLPRMTLVADTAGDLMSSNPISLRREASIQEAVALMLDRDFDVAPVIDEKGKPVGVVSISDILVHEREHVRYLKTGDLTVRIDQDKNLPEEMGLEVVDRTRVGDIMTPTVFTVDLTTPAPEVVNMMISLHVHHLFVRDDQGTLVGVISSCDILRRLTI